MFVCEFCNKEFLSKRSIARHKDAVHVTEDIKNKRIENLQPKEKEKLLYFFVVKVAQENIVKV